MSALLRIINWQSINNDAQIEDQQILVKHLSELEANQNRLQASLSVLLIYPGTTTGYSHQCLDVQQSNIPAIMVSLQRHIQAKTATDQELNFFSHSLRYLSTCSGQQVVVERWMVTPFEVEFGRQIGAGGLFVPSLFNIHGRFCDLKLCSGQVFQGLWNKTEVALKVLKTEGGIMPSSAVSSELSRKIFLSIAP